MATNAKKTTEQPTAKSNGGPKEAKKTATPKDTKKTEPTPAAAAKKAGMTKPAKEVVEAVVESEQATKPTAPKFPAVYRDGTHTALVIEIRDKAVTMITMASLKLEEMRRAEFDATFELFPDYPVKRAAEVYLGSGQYRQIDPETRTALEAIIGNKSMEYKPFVSSVQPSKEATMPTTKATPTSHPLRRASDAPLRAQAAKEESVKPTTTKKPAESKEAKAPAKTTKAEKPAATTAKVPAKAAAPAAKKAAPAAKTAAPAGNPGGAPRTRIAPDAKATLGDTGKAKAGKMLAFIEQCVAMAKKSKGVIARDKVEAALLPDWESGEADLKTYFPYAVKNGLLVLA